MASMNKPAVIAITDALGSAAIERGLGVSEHSVRHARTTGAFPASWYEFLSGECGKEGIDCPMSAFNMKSPSASSSIREAS